MGFEKCYDKMRQHFYWPKMYSTVLDYINACDSCQRAKHNRRAPSHPLLPTPIGTLFEKVHVDVMGPLPPSDEGFKYVLVIVDSFSKLTEICPLKSQNAKEVGED